MKKSSAGRKALPTEKRKNIRFHFAFSSEQIEQIGGKEKVYKLIHDTVKKTLEDHE